MTRRHLFASLIALVVAPFVRREVPLRVRHTSSPGPCAKAWVKYRNIRMWTEIDGWRVIPGAECPVEVIEAAKYANFTGKIIPWKLIK